MSFAGPFFLWLNAEVDFKAVMTPDELAKRGAAMEAAVKKWAK